MNRASTRGMIERTVHDLKNPLSVVRASLEWLEVELADRADALDAVRDAATAAERLVNIVEDLDLVAHLELSPAIAKESIDIGSIVSSVSMAADERLAPRGITLATASASGLRMMGGPVLLRRAVDALVDVVARGAKSDSTIELAARVVGKGSHIELEVGLRGTVASGPPTESIDALASAGLSGYVALRVAEIHGGALLVIPTATFPRVVMRLPVLG